MGHLRVTIGHLRSIINIDCRFYQYRLSIIDIQCRLSIWYRLSIIYIDCWLSISIVDYRYRLSIIDIDCQLLILIVHIDCQLSISIVDYQYRLFSFLSLSKLRENLTELHPKVRPTCCIYLLFVNKSIQFFSWLRRAARAIDLQQWWQCFWVFEMWQDGQDKATHQVPRRDSFRIQTSVWLLWKEL